MLLATIADRASLLVVGARNQVGRALGSANAYTPGQRWTAKVIRNTVLAHPSCTVLDAAAIVGSTDGETSLVLTARGDRGQAGGMAQWHKPRRDIILDKFKVDVWAADAADQTRAMLAEMSEDWSSYRHVLPILLAARTIEAKIRVLVALYEQSGSQARDIARRTTLANYWLGQFEDSP